MTWGFPETGRGGGGGGVLPPGPFSQLYDVDFTSLTPQSFSPGVNTLSNGAKVWVSASFGSIAATGLVLNANLQWATMYHADMGTLEADAAAYDEIGVVIQGMNGQGIFHFGHWTTGSIHTTTGFTGPTFERRQFNSDRSGSGQFVAGVDYKRTNSQMWSPLESANSRASVIAGDSENTFAWDDEASAADVEPADLLHPLGTMMDGPNPFTGDSGDRLECRLIGGGLTIGRLTYYGRNLG